MAATSIKTSDGGFSKTGAGWGSITGLYSASAWTNLSNSAAQFATFGFTGLTGGVKVLVAVAYPAVSARCPTTPWQLLDSDGTTVLGSGTMNNKQETLQFAYDGVSWRWLAAVTPTGTTLTLKILANGGSSTVCVDGAYLQLASDPFDPATIAAGDLSNGSTWLNGTVPDNGTTGWIQPYVNEVPGTRITVDIATMGAMYALFGVKAGSSSAETLKIDYISIQGNR